MNQQQIINNYNLKFDEAVNFKRKGEYLKAISTYEELNNIAFDVPQVHESMAKCLAVVGDYVRSSRHFKLAANYYKEMKDMNKTNLCTQAHLLMSQIDTDDPSTKMIINAWAGK